MGRNPTDEELAKLTALPLRAVKRDQTIVWTPARSFTTPVGEWGSQLGDTIVDDRAASPDAGREHVERATILHKMLAPLSPRARRVLLRRAQDETFQEIAASLGVTRERIRQIEEKALARLKLDAHRYAADVGP